MKTQTPGGADDTKRIQEALCTHSATDTPQCDGEQQHPMTVRVSVYNASRREPMGRTRLAICKPLRSIPLHMVRQLGVPRDSYRVQHQVPLE